MKYLIINRKRQIPHEQFREIVVKQNFKCAICGVLDGSVFYVGKKRHVLRLTQDHIIPFSRGGKTVKENIQALCFKCNAKKANK